MLRSVSKALILVWLMAAVSSEAFLLAGTLHSQHGKRCGIVMSSIDDAALPARSQVRGLAVAGRREFLLRQQVVAGCVLGLCSPAQVHAASPPPGESGAEDVSQNIRKAAAKIPGMGPPDVAYPEGMLGRWQVQRVLADVDFPQGRENAQESLAEELLARKGRIDAFSARFIPGKNGIVSDREFNVRNLIKATEGTSVDVQWKVLNPNVLTVSYPNGALRETKVFATPLVSVDSGSIPMCMWRKGEPSSFLRICFEAHRPLILLSRCRMNYLCLW